MFYIVTLVFIIVVLGWMMFIPINLKLPSGRKDVPSKEVHEIEDVREFPMGENLDFKAHYHAKEEDSIM